MNSIKEYPFIITCRNCGSNNVQAIAFEHRDLEIKCKCCGTIVDCGDYMYGYDYSDMTSIGRDMNNEDTARDSWYWV